jgi:hypothetical protein
MDPNGLTTQAIFFAFLLSPEMGEQYFLEELRFVRSLRCGLADCGRLLFKLATNGVRITGRSPSLRHLAKPNPYHGILRPRPMLASKPECAVLQRGTSLAATYVKKLKLAIAPLETVAHRRVALSSGGKLLWRGSWDHALGAQDSFLGARSKYGRFADRRETTTFTRLKRHFQISDRVAILIILPSAFRTPEFGINSSRPDRTMPHLAVLCD